MTEQFVVITYIEKNDAVASNHVNNVLPDEVVYDTYPPASELEYVRSHIKARLSIYYKVGHSRVEKRYVD